MTLKNTGYFMILATIILSSFMSPNLTNTATALSVDVGDTDILPPLPIPPLPIPIPSIPEPIPPEPEPIPPEPEPIPPEPEPIPPEPEPIPPEPEPTTVNLTVQTAYMSGNSFSDMWVELWQNGVLIQEGFSPFSTTAEPNVQYEVFIANWGDVTFDHWEDGSTSQFRSVVLSEDTTITAFFQTGTTPEPEPGISSITKIQSGLVSADLLNDRTRSFDELKQDTTDLWFFGGSALAAEPDAPHTASQDSEGLHMGVQSPNIGDFAGLFAVTVPEGANLAHAEITVNQATTSSNFFNTGLFIQSSAANLNYVTCVGITGTAGTTWHLFRTTSGDTTQATGFERLWSDPSPNQPLTRDCTIVTNGDNTLNLYMDGVMVYNNSTIDLQMEQPFHVFLEVQSSNTDGMLFGIFEDFYTTTNEILQVNVPQIAQRVDIVDTTGSVIASTQAIGGTAFMDVGTFHFPLVANIKAFDALGNEIASTTTPADIFGGDVFSASP